VSYTEFQTYMDASRVMERYGRKFYVDQPISNEDTHTGCLLRIARSIENIERMMYERTPEGRNAARIKVAENKDRKQVLARHREMERWFRDPNTPRLPKGMTRGMAAWAFTRFHGIDTDFTVADNWRAIANGNKKIRGVGQVGKEKLRAFADAMDGAE